MAKTRHRGIEISTSQAFARTRALRPFRGRIFLTHLGLFAERVTRSFWPLWTWGFVLWTLFSFDFLAWAGIELAYFVTLGGGILALVFFAMGLRSFRWPDRGQAIDRLDRSLPGRPLSTLWDNQAIGARDKASAEVWRSHLDRMRVRANQARVVEPDLRISDLDPLGLRYVAATGAVIALLFSSGTLPRGGALDLENGDPAALSLGPVFEGWIEPPSYTGLPTLYLNEIPTHSPVDLPEGSRFSMRLYGDNDALRIEETLSGATSQLSETDDASQRALDFEMTTSGRVVIKNGEEVLSSWSFQLVPDQAPVIAIAGPVERTPAGETVIDFEAGDDYGVVAAQGRIRLDMDRIERRYGLVLPPEPRPEIGFDLPMPFNGKTNEFSDRLIEDLSRHPWVGLPVLLDLKAFDARDQSGHTGKTAIFLPGRRFFDPIAAALIEQRRDLLWNRMNARRVSQVLRAVTHRPEDLFENERAYLLLRTTIRQLEQDSTSALSDENRDEIAENLWRIALLIEDGALGDAAERLRRAQERLSEALENGATEDEVSELMDELRKAMRDYLEKLAEDSERNPERDQAQNGETREITENQLQQMLEQIEELFRQGRNEEAQELLEQLREMMENMQTARRQQGEGQEGQQSMRELSDTMRQQQNLSDDSFRQLQEQFNGQRQPGELPNPGQPGQGDDDTNGRDPGRMTPEALAERQEQLRELLESQRESLPGPETEEGRAAREALRQAEREMAEARDALRQGDLPEALDQQAEALEALREGLENLGRELARNQNEAEGRQGDQAGSPDPDSERDPLGRQSGSLGRIGTRDEMLGKDDPILRSRELMEEIRRRSGDKTRPRIELDYLERLLDRF